MGTLYGIVVVWCYKMFGVVFTLSLCAKVVQGWDWGHLDGVLDVTAALQAQVGVDYDTDCEACGACRRSVAKRSGDGCTFNSCVRDQTKFCWCPAGITTCPGQGFKECTSIQTRCSAGSPMDNRTKQNGTNGSNSSDSNSSNLEEIEQPLT